jgi:hypothetical protein
VLGAVVAVIPVLRRLRQEDLKFEGSLGYMRPCFKRNGSTNQ